MYEIIDVIRDYLFVTLRLRDVQTGVTRDWRYWDDLEEWNARSGEFREENSGRSSLHQREQKSLLCLGCASKILRQEHFGVSKT